MAELPFGTSIKTDKSVKVKYVDYGGPAIDICDARWESYSKTLQVLRGDGVYLRLELTAEGRVRFEGHIKRSVLGRSIDKQWASAEHPLELVDHCDECSGNRSNHVEARFAGVRYWPKSRDRMKLAGDWHGNLEIDYPE
ncbi:hypothetical protein [Sandaracinus amylolyticus]|uniref:hypothetical protein n=1 Tax=Sandaracinus amylolyticus TaxID=927083 RepID=UPI001F294DEE|nr:hypothetical protein [Sandaracinus amylolyticus]UJR84177.1 Hypothetical protein I5071_62480 [Sandaracinus amylolyticus]